MSRRRLGWGRAVLLLTAPGIATAQQLVTSSVTVGFESRYYDFGPYFGAKSLAQWAVPVAAAAPLGRLTFDVGAFFASTTLTRRDGAALTVTDLTDTQLRAAYVFGQDAVVATAMVNLPTGASDLTPTKYAVLAAASSSFLAFPVNAYGSGLSLTSGLAVAFQRGAWNLGVAGSLRVSDDYTAFTDADGPFTYQSGLEARLRVGADRLVGPTRLTLGLTYSTFATDEFATGSGAVGVYRPGRRLIGEASVTGAVGSTAVTGYLWDFYRMSGDSAGQSAENRENLAAGGVAARVPLRRTISWEPAAEFRLFSPEEGDAALMEFATAFRIRVTRRFSLVPSARFAFGRLKEPDPGIGHQILGYGLSVFVRESF